MIRAILIACLAALVPGCASQKAHQSQQAPLPDPNAFAPPELSQPNSAPAAASSVTPAAPQTGAAPAAAPGEQTPPAPIEQLAEMSSSSANTPAATAITRPCNFYNCGVILLIYQGSLQPELAMNPAYGPGVGVAWDNPWQPYGDGFGVETLTKLWEIEVRMNDGSKRVIHQQYQPFLHIGDPVLVDGNNLQLWN